ncbi:actin-histidine N-methyltransferase-like [Homarus americanus]|uniref:protein-histidine N-methyltransferase n=1 Tax=Homarus americanus TaxID=6706 RepID=A0A8J5JR30_HOMAM|nr:actin-histidine N-methyltransferase-like [Homarus americanus]
MGKKRNAKKATNRNAGPVKLLPQIRGQLTAIVDDVFKRCTKVPPAVAPSAAQEWAEYLEIYELIEKIQDLEKGMCGTRHVRYPAPDVYSDRSSGTLYVLAEGEKNNGPLIERDPILQHMGNVALALHVLGEFVNPQSSWQPYLRILPSTYSTTLYFTPQQLQSLKGSPVLEEAVKQFRNIARQYSYFYRILQSSPEAKSWPIRDYFTFKAYRWAVSTVMTRQNRVPVKESSGQMALIPAWDMTNHEQGIYSTDYDNEENCSVCLAQRDFKAGEQFSIHYSQRPNTELFLHNGFVYRDNKNDSLAIKLGVSKDDPLHDEKVALLSSLGLPSAGSFMLIPGQHPVSPGLLAFIRVFSSLDKWKDDGEKAKGLLHEDCDVGTTVQDKTWSFLNIRVALLIRSYPTTLEEDEAALPTLSGVDSLIRSQVICEKIILRDAALYLTSHISK